MYRPVRRPTMTRERIGDCRVLFAFVLCLLGAGSVAAQEEDTRPVYEQVLTHYESMRQALLHDTLEGVERRAGSMREAVLYLKENFSAERAGIKPENAGDLKGILLPINTLCRLVEASGDIEEVRKTFSQLSDLLIRWRGWSTMRNRPVIAYCPMDQKSWLQPAGEIGNPYAGQKMPRCGKVVTE